MIKFVKLTVKSNAILHFPFSTFFLSILKAFPWFSWYIFSSLLFFWRANYKYLSLFYLHLSLRILIGYYFPQIKCISRVLFQSFLELKMIPSLISFSFSELIRWLRAQITSTLFCSQLFLSRLILFGIQDVSQVGVLVFLIWHPVGQFM